MKISMKDVDMCRPFEKEQYILKMMRRFGIIRERASQEWNGFEANDTRLDYKGRDGQIRLWLQSEEGQEKAKERYKDFASEEGSDRIKQPTAEVRDALRRHAHGAAQGCGHGDEFFHGRSTLREREERENAQGPAKKQKMAMVSQ